MEEKDDFVVVTTRDILSPENFISHLPDKELKDRFQVYFDDLLHLKDGCDELSNKGRPMLKDVITSLQVCNNRLSEYFQSNQSISVHEHASITFDSNELLTRIFETIPAIVRSNITKCSNCISDVIHIDNHLADLKDDITQRSSIKRFVGSVVYFAQLSYNITSMGVDFVNQKLSDDDNASFKTVKQLKDLVSGVAVLTRVQILEIQNHLKSLRDSLLQIKVSHGDLDFKTYSLRLMKTPTPTDNECLEKVGLNIDLCIRMLSNVENIDIHLSELTEATNAMLSKSM